LLKEIRMKPIGLVKTEATEEELKDGRSVSEIILSKDLEQGLEGVEEFSHLFILFWMHRIPRSKKMVLRVHPRGCRDLPLVGVFATRTPYRLNPIGLTVVELIERKGSTLKVKGLDAADGTPVLDIKPCDPWGLDKKIRVPEWWNRLEERSKKKTKASSI